jgi:hypothetical protein
MVSCLACIACISFVGACGSGSSASGGNGGASYEMPSPISQVTPAGSPLPLKYGLARKYGGETLFDDTWVTTPPVGFVVILSSAPITCATNFISKTPFTDSPAEIVFPFFVDASVNAEAKIIGIDTIGADSGSGVGSSGQKDALDAYIKASSASSVSGTINYNGWNGSFVVPVCP